MVSIMMFKNYTRIKVQYYAILMTLMKNIQT